eukprot:3343403-Amphidinium_carterae.1
MSTTTLRSLLRTAKPTWSDRDLQAAETKLERIGVVSPQDLARALEADINQKLQECQQRVFSAETLQALRTQ